LERNWKRWKGKQSEGRKGIETIVEKETKKEKSKVRK